MIPLTPSTPQVNRLLAFAAKAWRPPPQYLPSLWAEDCRVLSQESSAEYGPWVNSRTPHLVKVMDCFSPYCQTMVVVAMFASQSGKTEILLNAIGYSIECVPGPILVVQPNVSPMGEAFSKDRVAPMLRDSPTLAERIGKQKARDSANTVTHKRFPGGHLTIAGANSAAGLASRPIRILLCDEIDRWEMTKEGSSLLLARKRLQTYRVRRMSKEVIVSSPTFEDMGVHREYQACEQQWEWHLVCEHCGETQFPKLQHFHCTNKDPSTVVYACQHCGGIHPLSHADRMKLNGRWVCVKEGAEYSVGFTMNEWGSSLARWDDTLREWFDAEDNPEKKQVVTNTAFCETWDGEGEKADPLALMNRAEEWESVPEEVDLVTLGVDVQGDRLEVEIVGWNGIDSFSLGYEVFPGEPEDPATYEPLLDLFEDSLFKEDGSIVSPSLLCIDSGAFTKHIYEFVARAKNQYIIPVKGANGMGRDPIMGDVRQRLKRSARRLRDGRPPEILGVDVLKVDLFRLLNVPLGKPGHCRFPKGRSLEYYQQLTGERLLSVKNRGGRIDRMWVQIHTNVEALDCRVYNMAARILANDLQMNAKATTKRIQTPGPKAPPRKTVVRSSSGFGKPGWGI